MNFERKMIGENKLLLVQILNSERDRGDSLCDVIRISQCTPLYVIVIVAIPKVYYSAYVGK